MSDEKRTAGDDRARLLAEALRANLRRRKARARVEACADRPDDGRDDDGEEG
jgi:hypothetical protein